MVLMHDTDYVHLYYVTFTSNSAEVDPGWGVRQMPTPPSET